MYLSKIVFFFTFCSACLLADVALDTVQGEAAYLALKNGQSTDIALLDTVGTKISYLRRGTRVHLNKTLIKYLVIKSDTIVFSESPSAKQKAIAQKKADSVQRISAKKPKTISAEEYYSDKAPKIIPKALTKANVGNGLTFLGIGIQITAILKAQDLGLLPTIFIATSGIAANIIGPTMAVHNYYGVTDVIEQAYGCEKKPKGTYITVNRIALGVLLAGSIVSAVLPSAKVATWENSDGTGKASFSISPVGLIFSSVAGIAFIINNQCAAANAYLTRKKCVPKTITVVPILNNSEGYGVRLMASL